MFVTPDMPLPVLAIFVAMMSAFLFIYARGSIRRVGVNKTIFWLLVWAAIILAVAVAAEAIVRRENANVGRDSTGRRWAVQT